ncbi:diguanylate cyclase/phosphodiesterase [Couchioplanes caeruleus]|uniref:Diguanylate cyclase n=2 Tax=Couchioplanes caeruleus TaxID=56438 RepID=A0A1K0FLT2_9ACTN|nr:bifunctional diguanylate cyclase/phosphodiesterase [Couchioplanes caeruleus]OJF13769.1 diguanylate cyclase [Couchioplanes caeruleus subsp. caeruleus]ROP32406.1 diguanylate cyclase/phosphodiesterase [Couchioplanes caeruleus]
MPVRQSVGVHSPSGVELAGLASLLVAVPAVALLGNSGRKHTGAARRAHLLLAAGAAVATGAALAGLVSALMAHEQMRAHVRTLGQAVAVAMALGTLTLLAGTLMLPGAAENRRAALRHLLDGLVIAAALWFVGWTLVSEPTRILGDLTPVRCLSVLLGAGVATIATGLTTILAVHAHRPRHVTVRVAAGVTLVAISATALPGGICQGGPVVILLGALLLPAGLVVVARAVKVADRPVTVSGDIIQRGTGYAFVPMTAMVIAGTCHILAGGEIAGLGFLGASIEGFALVSRQYLALGDVRSYTLRLRQREAHFRELAHTDPLTGLANRRGLVRALREPAVPGRPRTLVGLDLDGFKNVNDMRGHDVGDAVLAEVGARLRAHLSHGDVAARLGGDEFAVLMRATPDEAMAAGERLLAVLCEPYETEEGSVFLSASVGVAGSLTPGDTCELMRDADLALRYAKQRGKNRVERYQKRYDELLRRHSVLENELRHAIERDQLRLVFQPVVALPSVRPVGAEALLRWHHPDLGSVRPDEFIPVAEESGLIGMLGAWVLDQACGQLAQWLTAGHDVWVSVNLSPKELHAADYAGQVAAVLDKYGVPPQRLVLEVTEHAVATDMDELIRRLVELRSTGVRIALDDFGAGYSSLGQLRNLPVDILKIDHALVAEPESRTGTAAPLVDVVVRLGHRLGLEVLAEGIGTPAQREIVEAAGCRLGQGSLFGWGVPAEHLEAQLRAGRSCGSRQVPAPRSRPAPIAPGVPARSQIVMLGPGMRQVRAVLPTDPAFSSDQDVRSVDAPREMGQS